MYTENITYTAKTLVNIYIYIVDLFVSSSIYFEYR